MEKIRNTFAILGVVSFIVLSCSAVLEDDSIESVDTNSSAIFQSTGKYQVVNLTNDGGGSNYVIGVLNTETGLFKTFYFEGGLQPRWIESKKANNTFNF